MEGSLHGERPGGRVSCGGCILLTQSMAYNLRETTTV